MTGANGKHGTPILDLDDLIEPGAQWRYKGNWYQFVRWSSLGLLDRKRITNRQQKLYDIEDKPEPTEADEAEYELAVREIVKFSTIDLPYGVLDAMDSEQRREVAARFLALRLMRTSLLEANRNEAGATFLTTALSTTETSSPDSKSDSPKRARKTG